ncbi:hypothetical protein [Desertivirga arenae]|uniref:pirin family protein n=1 Tax=Desertivirga arenae TaxID=2810309 RepID=UPI001A95D9DB|nr:hypothetical protein [Pedobacter sp. SYSU D00823]
MKTAPGRILIAGNRRTVETNSGIFIHTFDCTGEKDEVNSSSELAFFSEEMLNSDANLEVELNESCWVLLLPVTGDLGLVQETTEVNIGPEEIIMMCLEKGQTYSIRNKNKHLIHYLHVRIRAQEPTHFPPSARRFNFSTPVASPLVQLNEDASAPFKLSIGSFAGRQEVDYDLQSSSSLLFTHVLAGAFEFEGRLLEVGDGLSLWDCETVEVEALSNNAVLIILELFN